MSSKDNAVSALKTEIKINKEVSGKLDEVITWKEIRGQNTDVERAESAEINSKLEHLEKLLAEINATKVVVSAPTPVEIEETSKYINTIRNIAKADAATSAGLAIIKDTLRVASSKLQEKVKTT